PLVDAIKNRIKADAANDLYRTYDYGYTYDDFLNSFITGQGGHVKKGIRDYIFVRNITGLQQLDFTSSAPVIWWGENFIPRINQPLEIYARVEDDQPNLNVVLEYQLNGGALTEVPLLDDGQADDTVAMDEHYRILLSGLTPPYQLEYRIKATDLDGRISYFPEIGFKTVTLNNPPAISLAINEVMPMNLVSKADEFNQFDDWIELYNFGTEIIDLSIGYLTDNPNNPNKWQMPPVNLNPNEFILFWADKETHQGPTHTNFSLSALGEYTGVYFGPEFGQELIDEVYYDSMVNNWSFGREVDGTGSFIVFRRSTPGITNSFVVGINANPHQSIKVYPNPTTNKLTITSTDSEKITHIHLIAVDGKVLLSENTNQISKTYDLSETSPGVYILQIQTDQTSYSLRIVKN
ncbi:MAG: T9SS type A sorting domain-containing protein, partial [Cyclobacteriaceae bacterium]|nr:T9SS type A sorting domain-containing protein [Cyclobacteriaceae bacterium]